MPRPGRAPAAPAFFHVPDGARFEIADEVADLMDGIGYMVDEPERAALRALLPQSASGDWIGLESAIVCPRQNLKTATMIACALHDTFVQGVERVVWTAHEFKTSTDAFRDFQALIEGTSWLESAVLKVRTANGKEGFELRNGSRLDILARTGRSGRGMGGDRLYLDEALYLEGKMMGALVPTMSARPNAHMVYGSSPGLPTSDVLRSLRDRGRAGDDPELGYIEWTSDRGPCARMDCSHRAADEGCRLGDESLWWQANPALGRRISVDFVRQERRALESAPAEFMRERLGWWEDPPAGGVDQVIPADSWAERLDEDSRVPDGADLVFAIDTSWDRQTTWIAVAATLANGSPHIEIVATEYGTEWVVPWLRERIERYSPIAIGLQGAGSPVSSILEPLQREFGELVASIGGQDLGRACGAIFDAVVNGPLAHVGQRQLDDAVRAAVIRPMGDSWLWDRKHSPVDIAPLVAATEALYLLQTRQKPKKKRSRVVGW